MSTTEHYLRADLHAYFLPLGPKQLRETLCLAQSALQARIGPRPSDRDRHDLAAIAELIRECDRQRPLGSDGKHGSLHTPECGCEDR